jgi:hypothetical protein
MKNYIYENDIEAALKLNKEILYFLEVFGSSENETVNTETGEIKPLDLFVTETKNKLKLWQGQQATAATARQKQVKRNQKS